MAPIIGIDPGVRGGMALLDEKGEVLDVIGFSKLKETEIADTLRHWRDNYGARYAYLEKVGFIKGDGGKGAFTFGRVYGFLRGVCSALTIHVCDVYPAMWQSRMGCLTGGNKNISKNRAIALFPRWHSRAVRGITHETADALLIAEYGRLAQERLMVKDCAFGEGGGE